LKTLNPNKLETYYHALQSSQGYLKPNLILHTQHGKEPHWPGSRLTQQNYTTNGKHLVVAPQHGSKRTHHTHVPLESKGT